MIARAGRLSLVLVAPSLAKAHGAADHPDPAGWSFDHPSLTVPLALTLMLFVVGSLRLWLKAGVGRGVPLWSAALFAIGWLTLAAALVSPLHELGERSLALHMIEHELLMAVAAPLLVCSKPVPAMLWALPRSTRLALGLLPGTPIGGIWRMLTRPLIATVVHGIAIWVWHVPLLFQSALEHEALHWLQHASFFVTALLFWWALLETARRGLHGVAVGDLFVTSVHTGLLGALMGLAPRLLYQPSSSPPWGITPLQDQQLAGLIMWVPGGTIYAVAALAFAAFWILQSGRASTGFANAKPAR